MLMIYLSSDMIHSSNENILKTFELTHFDNSFYIIGITPIVKRSNSQLISLKHKNTQHCIGVKKVLSHFSTEFRLQCQIDNFIPRHVF